MELDDMFPRRNLNSAKKVIRSQDSLFLAVDTNVPTRVKRISEHQNTSLIRRCVNTYVLISVSQNLRFA